MYITVLIYGRIIFNSQLLKLFLHSKIFKNHYYIMFHLLKKKSYLLHKHMHICTQTNTHRYFHYLNSYHHTKAQNKCWVNLSQTPLLASYNPKFRNWILCIEVTQWLGYLASKNTDSDKKCIIVIRWNTFVITYSLSSKSRASLRNYFHFLYIWQVIV